MKTRAAGVLILLASVGCSNAREPSDPTIARAQLTAVSPAGEDQPATTTHAAPQEPAPSRGREPELQTGLDAEQRRQIAGELSRVLADTYALYFKTLSFHWNVTGPHFQPLHDTFGDQYKELSEAVDVIAERVRALGYYAPESQERMTSLASIEDAQTVPPANEMIRILLADHEHTTRSLRRAFTVAEEANDQATADILADRMVAHEKTAWMLRSLLDRSAGRPHPVRRE